MEGRTYRRGEIKGWENTQEGRVSFYFLFFFLYYYSRTKERHDKVGDQE